MASCNNNDLHSVPSIYETASAPTFARVLDWLAGPLALAAAGLTFFAAYDLTVSQPPELFAGLQPAFVQTVAAPFTALQQPDSRSAVNAPRAYAQENSKTLSMLSGPAPQRY